MGFAIGDEVVCPNRGAGRIIGLEHQEWVEGFEEYCVIDMFGGKLTVRLPMRKMDELGVRPVMSRAKIARVLKTLGGKPHQLPKDYKQRHERIREKLGTGRAIQIAEAVRDLTWREQSAHLTKTDSALLARGRELLAGEIALVTENEVATVNQTIDAALAMATASEHGEEPEPEAATSAQPLNAEGKRQRPLDSLRRYAATALGLRAK